MSNTNIECDHLDHNSFYQAYDQEFADQKQFKLLFCTWNFQTKTLLVTTPLKNVLGERLQNENKKLTPSEHFTMENRRKISAVIANRT